MFISAGKDLDLRVIWADSDGCLVSRLLHGGVCTKEGYIGIPFISLGEVCLLITPIDRHGTASVFRPGREDTSIANNIYLGPSNKPPHVARLPNGDEIVSYMYAHFDNYDITMVIFRICCRDKTCMLISSINSVYRASLRHDHMLYAYLPSKGKIITRPNTCNDFSGYSYLISSIIPSNITLDNVPVRVQRIFDTFGDRMLILAHMFNERSDTYYIADYSFSTQAATILDVYDPYLRQYNAGYAAENIVMMITLIDASIVVRKIVNMTDCSEYILTDPV